MLGPGNNSHRNCMSTIVYQCIVIAGCKGIIHCSFPLYRTTGPEFRKMAPLFNIIIKATETVL